MNTNDQVPAEPSITKEGRCNLHARDYPLHGRCPDCAPTPQEDATPEQVPDEYRLAERIHAKIIEWQEGKLRFHPSDIYLILKDHCAALESRAVKAERELAEAREAVFSAREERDRTIDKLEDTETALTEWKGQHDAVAGKLRTERAHSDKLTAERDSLAARLAEAEKLQDEVERIELQMYGAIIEAVRDEVDVDPNGPSDFQLPHLIHSKDEWKRRALAAESRLAEESARVDWLAQNTHEVGRCEMRYDTKGNAVQWSISGPRVSCFRQALDDARRAEG